MESGKEIVFADELGGWMIPVETRVWVTDYLTALAATQGADDFARKVLPLVRRDSYQSFHAEVFKTALKLADKQQAAALRAEADRQNVQTRPDFGRKR
jgi:hypothetical protein